MSTPAPGAGLASVEHVVVLMLENRSFDHMLGYLYAEAGNTSPAGHPAGAAGAVGPRPRLRAPLSSAR